MSNQEFNFKKDDFQLANRKDLYVDKVYENQSFWGSLYYVVEEGAVFGMVVIVIIVLFAVFAPMLSSHSINEQVITQQSLPPRIPVIENLGILDGWKEKMVNGPEQM